jgi:hypothetical protein
MGRLNFFYSHYSDGIPGSRYEEKLKIIIARKRAGAEGA